jgi:hypothetical protein
MRVAFLIFVGYASLGLVYAPGLESLVALVFISASCSPLLLAGRDSGGRSCRGLEVPRVSVFSVVVALGIFNVTLVASAVGQPVSDLLSLEGVVRVAALSTARRYEVGGSTGNPILLAFSMWLLFRMGTSVDRAPKAMLFTAFLPLVAYSVVSTEKWPLFLGGVFFFGGVFLSFPLARSLRISFRYIVVAAPSVIVVSGLAMVLRGFTGQFPELASGLLHYVLAPYPAFGAWLLDEAVGACCTLGGLSFVGPLDALGLATREAGVFGTSAVVYGREINIYTSFRYLVQDFSLLGPFVIMFGLTVVQRGLAKMGATAWSRQLVGFVIFSALLSVSVTPFVHNSTALAVFLSLASMLIVAVRLPPMAYHSSPKLLEPGGPSDVVGFHPDGPASMVQPGLTMGRSSYECTPGKPEREQPLS